MPVSARRAFFGVAIVALGLVAAQSVASAQGTPRWIVFSGEPGGTALPQLFRVQTTGADLEQITTGAKPATQPAFSPDGDRLVFTRLGSGIFRANLDGTGLTRLTSGVRDTYPVWSPDGKRIAFVRPYRTQWRVHVMSPSGAGQRRLPQAPPTGRPSWSANSKSIFIPTAASIAKLDARTGRVQKRYAASLDPAISQGMTVSPDGRQFTFIARRPPTGPPDCGESNCPAYALYVAAAATPGRRRRLANDTGPAGWAPDSKTVVFVVRGELTVEVVSSGKQTKIPTVGHVPGGDASPAWQPR
jgi:dipeptidyl aminopeptidase/acylaminoacyl peptidase